MCRVISSINDLELTQKERQSGVQDVFNELLHRIHHQPIHFTIAGFVTINKSFLASVSTGVLTYVIILVQFYKE